MGQFVAGLVLFFGIHSVSIFALPLRDRLAAKNKLAWRGLYSLVSVAGIVMVAQGYAELRREESLRFAPLPEPDPRSHRADMVGKRERKSSR